MTRKFQIGQLVKSNTQPQRIMRVADDNESGNWEDWQVNCEWFDYSLSPPKYDCRLFPDTELEMLFPRNFAVGNRVLYVPAEAGGSIEHPACKAGAVAGVRLDGAIVVQFDDDQVIACAPGSLVLND